MIKHLIAQKNTNVSVIMNCLNCSKYLRDAIDSVYGQTYKDWEIIFWDSGSTDNSPQIARSYGDRLRYFRGEISDPLYAARNKALKRASGKYIAFLDCDDKWLPDKLQLQIEAFEGNQTVGLIHSNVRILEFTGSVRIKDKKVQPSGKVFRELLKDYRINLQSVMISRKALCSLDRWFDDSMYISGDVDLFLRISYDWEVLYLPQILAEYREHGSSLSATRIDRIVPEWEQILTNLSNKYNRFTTDYKYEIQQFRSKALLSVAVAKWKYCNGTEARKVLKKNLSSAFFAFLYILSILPYRIPNYFRGLLRL